MVSTIKFAPPNSLVFLSDPDGEPPVPVWGAQIQSTPSCISIVCYPEQDGPTEFTVGTDAKVDPLTAPTFAGVLQTPHRTVILSTVDQKILLKVVTTSTRTDVRIWLSHPRWPERVVIGLS